MIKDFMDLSMEDKIKIISLGLGVLGFLISLTNVIILMYSRKVKLNFGIEHIIIIAILLLCAYLPLKTH